MWLLMWADLPPWTHLLLMIGLAIPFTIATALWGGLVSSRGKNAPRWARTRRSADGSAIGPPLA